MAQKTNPHSGHRDRVRERIITEGLSNFQPHEVLEFLLYHTVPQKDTNPLAHELIQTFGSFENVLEASPEELMKRGKLSMNNAVFLSSLTQIFSYYEKAKKTKISYNTPEKMISLFKPYFIGQTTEKLVLAFFDSGLRLKGVLDFKAGQENGFNFNIKDILRKAVSLDAYSVVMSHNHPTSNFYPSSNDASTTSELKSQLEHIGIKLIDHLIFDFENEAFSFASSSKYCCFVSDTTK